MQFHYVKLELLLFLDLFLLLGSSVSIISNKLNLFLVSVFNVDGSVDWLGRFDNFKRSGEDEFGVWPLLNCGERSALSLFGSGFEVWFFFSFSILEVGGRIGDLRRFCFLGGVVCVCAVVFVIFFIFLDFVKGFICLCWDFQSWCLLNFLGVFNLEFCQEF